MNRRSTLKTFLNIAGSKPLVGGDPKNSKKNGSLKNDPSTKGLTRYSGDWGYAQAAHLLRRTTFGPTIDTINDTIAEGLDNTINTLFATLAMPDPPVNHQKANAIVPIGQTWINAPYADGENGYRNNSLFGWTFSLLINEEVNIREKMVLFWHNHFVTADINDPRFRYNYIHLIRSHALGNFRQFTKEMTIDGAMLRYLNGYQNRSGSPNENYARELLELFTIGKGPIAGPGDYTNYTEDDVVALAKALTGWQVRGFNARNGALPESFFNSNRHDKSNKQLSHRFDNQIISNLEETEYIKVVDIIFEKEEVSKFLCRKLYRYFVYHHIDSTVEQNVIEPMAQLLRDSDYDIVPALKALLASEHFFDEVNYGVLITNPIDHVVRTVKTFEVSFPTELLPYYNLNIEIGRAAALMQMIYFAPPSVSGWNAYYQEPGFYQIWINSVTLPYRMLYTDAMATIGVRKNGKTIAIDVLKMVAKVSNPSDPNVVVDEFAQLLFPKEITQAQKDFLKDVLIPGLPDFEWTVEYGLYLNDPDDEQIKASVELKLRNFVKSLLNMPEAILC